jgi:hypothetical protein
MRKIILGLLLLVSGYVMAQPPNYVPYASRNRLMAMMIDSTLHIPRFCGSPSLRTGGSTNDGAIAADTCNGRFYMYYNTSWVLINKDTSNTFINSLYKKTGTDSVFQIKGDTHTFVFTVGSGSGGSTDTTSLSTRINAKADTSAVVRIDTTGKATGKIPKWDATYGGFKMANDSVGSGGSGAFSVLKWRTGDEFAPAAGDSLIKNTGFSGKYGEMYRGSNYGYFLESVVGDTGFTRVDDTTFKVKPPFAANEWYYIRLTDSASLTQLTLQDNASHGATSIAYSSSADGGNNGGSGTSRTWSHTVSSGADRYLLVGFVGDVSSGSDDVSTVTYNGVSMTLIAKQLQGATSGNRWQYVYGLANPDAGAHNVVVTFSSSHWILGGSIEYTGVQGVDTYTTATAFTNSKTTSLTTGVNNCWTVLYSNGNAVTQSAGSGSTLRRQASDTFWAWFDSGADITPAGSYSMNTTMTPGSGITHIMISLKPY